MAYRVFDINHVVLVADLLQATVDDVHVLFRKRVVLLL